MLTDVMLGVVMLSVVMLNVIVLCVVAPILVSEASEQCYEIFTSDFYGRNLQL
jgi:hypothetical protein